MELPRLGALHRELGYAAFLNARISERATYPIGSLRAWVEPAILMRQARFVFDEAGQVIGYYTWAYLAHDIAERYIKKDILVLELAEWCEGNSLWIIDFVALSGAVMKVVRAFLSDMNGCADFNFLSRSRNGTVQRSMRVQGRRVTEVLNAY
ncbi:toxin-activating lysine-acyltransferase [Xanthomonas vasicola]|uniref:toxin-activating lysine-acyltransferase n=1 Tax=Xanthomonas vasicola TaxID=56459 RepID=UPI0009EB025F|nr:toxin-activating lysine-acyltransferase [Xanthomonas vasicola]